MRSTERESLTKAIAMLKENTGEKCALSTDAESEIERLSQRVYVPPNGQVFNAQASAAPLFESMDAFLQETDKRIAVILGNPGAGKTTFAKRWLFHHLQNFNTTTPQSRLPLFIALPALGSLSLKDYLTQEIGLSVDQVNEIRRQLPLIIFLDGYDEVAYNGNLYQDKHLDEWKKAKFIISTRPEKFGEHLKSDDLERLLIHRFSPRGKPHALLLYTLNDFTLNDIQLFIQQWELARLQLHPSPEEKDTDAQKAAQKSYDQLKQLRGLIELASNPVILSLILYALPGLYAKHQALSETERQHLMRIDIYDQFVAEWFARQGIRLMQKLGVSHPTLKALLERNFFKTEDYLRRYTQNLAYSNLQGSEDGKLKIEIQVADTLHLDLLRPNGQPYPTDQVIDTLSPDEKIVLLESLRSGCLLKCDKESFKFLHKSLIEYFTQAHMVVGLGRIDQLLFQRRNVEGVKGNEKRQQQGEEEEKKEIQQEQGIDSSSLSLNTMLLRDEPNTLSFLAEQAEKDVTLREALYKIMRLSKEHADMAIASANAMMILKRINAPLNKESWRKIKIPGADLSRAILHNVDFREADLQGVNLANAYLEGANFEGALLSHCHWGSAPFIPFKSDISALACTWDNEYVLVGDAEGTIHYVELASEVVRATVTQKPFYVSSTNKEKLKAYRVNALAVDGVTEKQSVFFASACQQSIFLWDIKKQKYLGVLEGHTATVAHLTYTFDGQRLASSDSEGNVRLWDPIQRVVLQQVPFRNSPQKEIMFLAYTPENTLMGITADARIVLEYYASHTVLLPKNQDIEAADKEEKPAGPHQLLAASYHPAIDCLAILSIRKIRDDDGSKIEQTIASCWDIKTRRCVMSVDVTGKDVVAVTALSTNTFVVGYSNGEMQLYEEGKGFAARSSTNGASIAQLMSITKGSKWMSAASDRLYLREREDVRWSVSDIDRKILAVAYQSNPLCMLIVQEEKKEKKNGGVYQYDLKQGALKEYDILFSSFFVKLQYIHQGQLQHHFPHLRLRQHLCVLQHFVYAAQHSVSALALMRELALARELERLLEQEPERVLVLALKLELMLERALELEVTQVDTTPIMRAKLSWDINCLAYFSQTQQVALGSDRGIVELLTLEGNVVQRITLEGGPSISTMAYSPDGTLLAVASEDKMLHCFALSNAMPVRVARLSTLELVIQTLQFTQNAANELELHAGAFKGNQLQSLVFQTILRPGQSTTWQLVSAWNKDFVPNWRGVNLQSSTGLTQTQFGFLTQQGAAGRPATFFHDGAMNNEAEEHHDLREFENLLKRLERTREGLPQESSLFHPNIRVSLNNWAVIIFRSSKIAQTERFSGLWFFNPSGSSASNSTQHAYGLLEGLDVRGRRVFIRIDLVGPDKPASYARIKNKCSVATGATEADAKKAFLALFADGRSGTPQEVTYHVLGAISRDSVHRLCRTFIDDQNRQYSPEKNWPKTRIHYTLLGGAEQKTPTADNQRGLSSISRPDSPQIHAHNCLTYLRWRLSELSEPLDLPTNWRDFLYVDPQHVLPRQSHPGFDARNKVHTVLLTDWGSPRSAPSPS